MSGELVRISQMTPETAISIPTSDGTIEMSVKDVLQWIAPSAPAGEALKFLLFCRSTRLNPFLREAELISMAGGYVTVVGKAGWVRRMQEHPAYQGHEAGIILTNLETGDTREVEGTHFKPVPGQKWVLSGGWCRIHRSDRKRPFFASVSMAEYDKGQGTWKVIPATQIRKCALVACAREAFSLAGYDRDELPIPDRDEAPALRAAYETVPPITMSGGVLTKVSTHESVDALVSSGQCPLPIAHPGLSEPVAASTGDPVIEARYEEVQDATLQPSIGQQIREALRLLGIDDSHHLFREALLKRGAGRIEELTDLDAHNLLVGLNAMLPPPPLDEVAEATQPEPAAFEVTDYSRTPSPAAG